MSYHVAHITELESLPVGDNGLQWRPIRSRFGIEAFGVNAYTAEPGNEIVENHTEETYGHEELYIVVAGRATFTLNGEEIDAPAGARAPARPDGAPRGGRARAGNDGARARREARRGVQTVSLGALLPGRPARPRRSGALLRGEPARVSAARRRRLQPRVHARPRGGHGGAIADFRRAHEQSPDDVRTWAGTTPTWTRFGPRSTPSWD